MVGSSPWLSSRRGRVGRYCISGGHLGPDEPGEFSGDGGDHDVAVGLAFVEATEASAQTKLRGPGAGHDVAVEAVLATAQLNADPRSGPVRPGRFDQLGAQVHVAGMGDVAAAGALPAGVLRRGEPGEGHEKPGGTEAAPAA